MHRMQQPARRVGRRHPAPPLQDEIQRHVELDEERQDRDRDQRNEHPEQLLPERGLVDGVRNLDGVAERPVEEIEPDAERDLKLIDEDQEEDVDPRIEALAQGHRRQRPGADRDRSPCVEERVGKRHHPAHEGKVRNAEDGDAEQRGRKRQVTGKGIVRVGFRPVAEQRDDVGQSEQDRLEREQIRQDRQESRHHPPRLRGERSNGRGEADDQHHPVLLVRSDREREDGENGEAQHAHGRDHLSGPGFGRGRTSRRMRALEGRAGAPEDEMLARFGGGRRADDRAAPPSDEQLGPRRRAGSRRLRAASGRLLLTRNALRQNV